MKKEALKRNLLATASVLALGSFVSGHASAAALTATGGSVADATLDGNITLTTAATNTAADTTTTIILNSGSTLTTGSGAGVTRTGATGAAGDAIATSASATSATAISNVDGATITSDTGNSTNTIDINHTIGTITNLGTIAGSANNGTVIDFATGIGGSLVNGNSAGTDVGTISAHGTGTAIKVAGTLTGSITNYTGSLIKSTGDSTTGVIDVNGIITGSLTNAGTVSTDAGGIAVDLGANVTGGVSNSGKFSATTGTALNISASTVADVTNTGTITATGGLAVNVANTASITKLTNSGLITDTTTGGALKFAGSSTTVVSNSGTISAQGAGLAINIDGAVTGGITNSGTISSAGLTIDDDGGLSTGITNTGTISSSGAATSAIDIADGIATGITNTAGSITAAGSAAVINYAGTSASGITNTGTIKNTGTGTAITVTTQLDGASGIITNSGLIQAAAADALNIADIDGTITNTGTIQSSSGNNSAIEITAWTAANLTSDDYINNSGLITAAGSAATIIGGQSAIAAGDITNTGSITNTGTGAAIDLSAESAGADAITIVNSGTISVAASTTNAITLGAIGALTNTGTITGGITLSSGIETFTMTSGTVTGNIADGSGGADVMNWNGGTITGTISLGSEDGDILNVGDASTDSITTGGAISGLSDLEIEAGTFNIGHNITLTESQEADENFVAKTATTVNVTDSVTLNAGDIDLEGNATLKIAAGKTLTVTSGGTTEFDVASAATLDFGVASASSFAKIAETESTGNFNLNTGSTLYFRVSGSNYIATATTLTDVIAADDIDVAGSNLTSTTTGLTFDDNSYTLAFSLATTSDSTGLDVLVTRENTFDDSSSISHISNVGAALETIGNGGDADLDAIVGALDAEGTAAEVAADLETLTPDVSGALSQAVDVANDAAIGAIESHLEFARNDGYGAVATGSAAGDSGVWGQVFGTAADQGWKDGVSGYQADTAGFAVGADTLVGDKTRVGLSLAYANSSSESEHTDADIDSYQVAAYGTRDYGKWFAEGLAAFTFNSNSTERTLFDNSIAEGDFDGQQYTAKVGGGYKVDVQGGLKVTPKASLQYTFITTDTYTETGSNANLTVNSDDRNVLKSSIGVDLAYPIVDGSVTYIPKIKAAWLYDFIGDEQESTNNFTSATGTFFTTEGADVSQSSFKLGAGVDVLAQDNVTVSFDYDWTSKEAYDAHTGSLKARFAF